MLKFIKKFSMFILVAFTLVVLASCIPSGGDKDVTISIEGLKDAYTFNTGDEFSKDILLNGVKAIGSDGNDYTKNIVVSGLDRFKVVDGKLSESGSGNIKVEVVVDGSTVTSKFASVTVVYVAPVTDDIIVNGDFATGSRDPFTYGEANGGTGELTVENEELKMTVLTLGWAGGGEAFPRAESNVFTLEDGKFYEYSFDIRANVATSVQVQIGELLSADPWFNQLLLKTYAVSTEKTTISYRFKASATEGYDLTKLQLLFGFGTHDGFDSVCTDVFMDNIKIVEVDSLGEDTEAPEITASDVTGYIGDQIKLGYTVKDNQDENPTVTTDADTVIPQADGKYTTEGTYKVTITAVDAKGNIATKEINVTVKAAITSNTNLVTNGDFSSSEFDNNWTFYAKDWLTLTKKVEDGKLVLTLAGEPDADNWGQQVKFEHLPLVEGKKYSINVVMSSSIDRKVEVLVQNDQWWNLHFDKIVDLTAGTDFTLNEEFTAVAPSPNVLLGIMLGNISGNKYSAEHTVTIKSVSITLVDDGTSVDPVDPTPSTPTKLPDMVGLVANKVESSVTVAWAGNTYNDYEVAGYKLTVKSSDGTVVHTNDNATNGYNFSIADLKADTYTVEIVVLGNGTSTSDSNVATATFTVEGTTIDPVDPVDPTPSTENPFTVTANTTAGAANNFTFKWNSAEYKVTKEPTKEDCSVSIGIVANFEFLVLNDEFVQVNIITGAEAERVVSIVLHTDNGDYKVTMTIANGEYASSTVEKVDCTHAE